jgi:cysteinyl-tRNA synthetase
MLVLNASYRGPLTFTDEVVRQAESALDRLRAALKPAVPASGAQEAEAALAAAGAEARRKFEAAMDDDFNTSGAMSHLFDLVRSINQGRDAGVGERSLGEAQSSLRQLAGVLGLRLAADEAGDQPAAPFIELLLEVREAMRTAKQWAVADRIRDRLAELGVVIEDAKSGTTWHRR